MREKMKILTILFLCGALTIHALPRPSKSPFFEIHNGVLVPTRNATQQSLGRIVGGSDAEPGSAPWMVTLQWGIVRPAHFCGGAIIRPNWVLTAGHCVDSYPDFGIATVVAGLHDLNDFTGNEQIRHVTRSNMWVHEDFDGYIGPQDIGLIVFQTPFTFDISVNAISLPEPDEMHTGVATLHGWGSVSNTFYPEYPNILQTANMPIIPIDTCRTSWSYDPDLFHDTHLCAGPLEGGVGACSLDGGGSLTQDGEIVGIFSWGAVPCGQRDRPAVYVRVSAYIFWIQEIMDNS